MGGALRGLVKDTAVYGLSSIIGRVLNWMLLPVYVRVLPNPGDYGIVTELYAWSAMLLVLLTYGMETGLFRFINKSEDREPLRVYGSILRTLAATSTLFFALIFVFINPLSSALNYVAHPEFIAIIGTITAVDAFCCVPFAFLRYQRRPVRFASLKLINIALSIMLNIFFLVLCPWLDESYPAAISWFYKPDYGVGYIFISNAITTLLTLVMLSPEIVTGLRARMNFPLLKRILRYSFPILLLGIAGILNQSIDKMLFKFLFDNKAFAEEQLGIYGACFKIAVIMVMFIQAFRYAYEPFVFAKNKDADNRKAYSTAMKYFIIFATVIFLGVMFYIDIIKLLLQPDYYSGLGVVPIVMLGELFFGVYFNLSMWYKLTDNTRWGAYFSVFGCILTVAIILIFVRRYGFMACAWASFFSNLAMMLLSYFIGRKKFPVAYDLPSALFYVITAAVFYAAAMLPDVSSLALRLTYRSILLIIYLGLIYRREFHHLRSL